MITIAPDLAVRLHVEGSAVLVNGEPETTEELATATNNYRVKVAGPATDYHIAGSNKHVCEIK